ncbi:MAG: sulfurtransferase-like selenium metabolism protein YedF, partial [Spirochaetia bacterium]|nr:sulfurtransferase-like selenium metabolism protein YedF [Spirochaetia bacterium]
MNMQNHIDATNKACPIPFMLAKKEIDAHASSFIIAVDNKGAVENLKRLAQASSYSISIEESEQNYLITFKSVNEKKVVKEVEEKGNKTLQDWVLFIGKDTMGEGAEELGKNLLRMFLYTINVSNNLPTHIVCMNSGVYLATVDNQTIATLRSLQEKGVTITVCGTCLDFYHQV